MLLSSFLTLLLATFLGILAGIFTGLIPGLHINLIAALAMSLSLKNPLLIACFLAAMAITHTFLDFIPSIFLGAPNDDTALGMLPGHRLLLKGYGFYAVKLTLIGSFYGFFLALALLPLMFLLIPLAWPSIKISVPFVLLAFSTLLILKERQIFLALLVFLLSGSLGILTFNLKVISQPLLPLFSGLFGLPLLFLSIKNKVKLRAQHTREIPLKFREKVRPLAAGLIASSFVSFYPAVGPGQAAIIGSDLLGRLNTKEFLILVGSINTIVMLFSFVTATLISKPRSGVGVAIQQILKEISLNDLVLLIAVSLIVCCLCVPLCLALTKLFSKYITKINYSLLCFFVISFVLAMNIAISGLFSLFVLATAFAIGLIPNIKEIRRIHLMGCLVLPVLGYYLL
ncbi:MAG: tripartite tricarboxylate transporter permease [Candidatus Pacearchaeota archaeon]